MKILNDVLATEIVSALRYKRHYFMAAGIHSESVRREFAQHAAEEQQQADTVAERITQLNGAPDFNPQTIYGRSHSEYADGDDLISMIKDDLYAERIAVESYAEIVRWFETTIRLPGKLWRKFSKRRRSTPTTEKSSG